MTAWCAGLVRVAITHLSQQPAAPAEQLQQAPPIGQPWRSGQGSGEGSTAHCKQGMRSDPLHSLGAEARRAMYHTSLAAAGCGAAGLARPLLALSVIKPAQGIAQTAAACMAITA